MNGNLKPGEYSRDSQAMNQEPNKGEAMEALDVEPETQALEVVPHDISIMRSPDIVLSEAQKAASALRDVLSKKARPVMMNGEQYLEFEDWQTLGRFYGVTARVSRTAPVTFGEAQGFEASADAVRADGMVISSAEAMCMNDEANWSYKPAYQLRSMAQTRACAKALRNVLAWVVVLAGYKATPAEEMTPDMNSGGGSRSAPTPAQECPKCEGDMWDNRTSKRNPRAPDYKCKDRSCDGAIWLNNETQDKPKRASAKDVDESRRVLIQSVADGFKVLNKLGHVPPWTQNSANEYVALHFQGAAGVDELDDGQVSDLLRMLSEKIDGLKGGGEKKKSLIASIETNFDTPTHLENYMKDHGGKKLEDLSIPELEAIEKEVGIPF